MIIVLAFIIRVIVKLHKSLLHRLRPKGCVDVIGNDITSGDQIKEKLSLNPTAYKLV